VTGGDGTDVTLFGARVPFMFDAAGICNRSPSHFADPGKTYQSLKDLGSGLKLSACWNVRPVVLEQTWSSPAR
jgi:hypothetical protein